MKRRNRGLVRQSKYARRRRDHAYLSWIRTLPCLLCGRRPAEAAHFGARAFGQKCSDRETGPLCAWDHRLGPHSQHALGKRFWQHHGLDRDTLFRELNESCPAIHLRIDGSMPRMIADCPRDPH